MCDKILAPDPQELEDNWASRYVDNNTGEVLVEFDANNNVIYNTGNYDAAELLFMFITGALSIQISAR